MTLHDLESVLRDVHKVHDTEKSLETQAMRDKRNKVRVGSWVLCREEKWVRAVGEKRC